MPHISANEVGIFILYRMRIRTTLPSLTPQGGVNTMKTNKHHDAEIQRLAHDKLEAQRSIDASRRNFGKAGLAASGVLLTLSSRSAMALTNNCTSPSGFQSLNASRTGGGHVFSCSGYQPAYWMNTSGAWVGYSPTAAFSSVFSVTGFGSIYAASTLMQVVSMTQPITGDSFSIGPLAVAALLNSVPSNNLTVPALNPAQVIEIFRQWAINRTYLPTAGTTWNETPLVTY